MTTEVVRAVKTSRQAAVVEQLEPWAKRSDATGDPVPSGTSLLPRDDLPGVGISGIWECTPGSWTIDGRSLTEVAFVVSGRGRISDADGVTYDLVPGDVLILPSGWSGRWEIFETLRKVYAIVPD